MECNIRILCLAIPPAFSWFVHPSTLLVIRLSQVPPADVLGGSSSSPQVGAPTNWTHHLCPEL